MPQPAVSQRAKNTPSSPIRKFQPFIRLAEERGLKVYKLNSGDPDLQAPPGFFSTIRKYPAKTLNYAPTPGIKSHVSAWQKYYEGLGIKLQQENIVPTLGCAEAILMALAAVADAGDEVLVFEPVYVSYKSYAEILGIKLVPVTLDSHDNFSLPSEPVIRQKISARTKAVVIINPDNPTGKLWNRRELETVLAVAEDNNLFVISDETYREIRFSGRPYCLLSASKHRERIILIDSVSKRFSIPGARVGCLASFNSEVMSASLRFAQARLSVGTLEQLATAPLLANPKTYTEKIRKEYQKRRDVVYEALRGMPGVKCQKPNGAFYITAKLPVESAEDFVEFLIKDFSYKGQAVMVSPLEGFYLTAGLGRQEIRIAYVLKAADLKKAMAVLEKGLEEYKKARI